MHTQFHRPSRLMPSCMLARSLFLLGAPDSTFVARSLSYCEDLLPIPTVIATNFELRVLVPAQDDVFGMWSRDVAQTHCY
jgi:hypothetical protein